MRSSMGLRPGVDGAGRFFAGRLIGFGLQPVEIFLPGGKASLVPVCAPGHGDGCGEGEGCGSCNHRAAAKKGLRTPASIHLMRPSAR